MAKTTLPTNYVDDVLNGAMDGKRRYREIPNADGTISLEDATTYDQIGNNFGASQVNLMNDNINQSFDANKMLKTMDEVNAVTQEGYGVDALVVKQLNSSLGNYELLLETNATNPTEYTVKDINSFRAISVMSYYTSGIVGNTVIPTSIFKTLIDKVVQSGFGTQHVSIVNYVSDTKISAYVGGQNASNTTCKVYGIK